MSLQVLEEPSSIITTSYATLKSNFKKLSKSSFTSSGLLKTGIIKEYLIEFSIKQR